MTDYRWPLLTETTRAIDILDRMVTELNRRLPQPSLRDEWFQYAEGDQGPQVMVLTRLVRIVSGLRCVKLLGEKGFLQEMGVLLRTVDDFCDEVTFVIEGHGANAASAQAKKHITHFFEERMLSKEEQLKRGKGPDRVKRDKVRAGQARFLQPDNPSDIKLLVGAIDHTFDSFVHGGYPAVMELYNGRTHSFELSGMSATRNLDAMRRQFLYYVARSLAVAGFAAFAIGFEDLGEQMKAANKTFCASSEYPGDT